MPEFSGSQHAYTCLRGLEYSLVRAVDASCPRNDTASVAALSDGRLMIVWHKYLSNERGTSDFGTIEIASRTSADGGRTWGDERILVRPDLTEDLSVQAPALRSPESCTCLRALPGTDDLLLCWIDSTYDLTHYHFGVRTPLALAL